jgi:hypothetical protein
LCIFFFTFLDWWAMGWTSRVQFPVWTRSFSLLHSAQAGSGAHPTSSPMGTKSSFPRGKVARAWIHIHLHLVLMATIVELYFHTPLYLQGVVLN